MENQIFRLHSLLKGVTAPLASKALNKIVNRNVSKTVTHPIDFVITWVDCNDPKWQSEYRQTFNELNFDPARYRDMNILKYWFRAVELYAPWVNKIYFVTNGQLPEWLNTSHEKIVHVKHEDFIPKEYLPTFSSRPIELNFHRIKGLSEHFVLFNDDMFINGPIEPSYYFQNGLPIDDPKESIAAESYIDYNRFSINLNMAAEILILNKYFSRSKVVHKHCLKWLPIDTHLWSYISLWPFDRFSHIRPRHVEQAYLKSSWQKVWETIPYELDRSCRHKRRSTDDITEYLMRYWQLASNQWIRRFDDEKYISFNIPKSGSIGAIKKAIESTEIKSICINDSPEVSKDEFEDARRQLTEAFEKKYPKKSAFEL